MIKKEIEGHPGYFVDEEGHVWHHNKRLASNKNGTGYQKVCIEGKQLYVQRLVCSEFKGHQPKTKPVCIRDAPGQQPRRIVHSQYLNWGTHKDIKRKKQRRLTADEVDAIEKAYKDGATQCELAKQYGVTPSTISYRFGIRRGARNKPKLCTRILSSKDRWRIFDRYNEGGTYQELAHAYGMNLRSIKGVISKLSKCIIPRKGRSHLTSEGVATIKRLNKYHGIDIYDLSRRYGVRQETIIFVIETKNKRIRRCNETKKSGHVGVYWHKRGKYWYAQANVNGKNKFLGCFRTVEDAVQARKNYDGK